MLIAATALEQKLTLISGNRKHFPIPELSPYSLCRKKEECRASEFDASFEDVFICVIFTQPQLLSPLLIFRLAPIRFQTGFRLEISFPNRNAKTRSQISQKIYLFCFQ